MSTKICYVLVIHVALNDDHEIKKLTVKYSENYSYCRKEF